MCHEQLAKWSNKHKYISAVGIAIKQTWFICTITDTCPVVADTLCYDVSSAANAGELAIHEFTVMMHRE